MWLDQKKSVVERFMSGYFLSVKRMFEKGESKFASVREILPTQRQYWAKKSGNVLSPFIPLFIHLHIRKWFFIRSHYQQFTSTNSVKIQYIKVIVPHQMWYLCSTEILYRKLSSDLFIYSICIKAAIFSRQSNFYRQT